MDDAVVQEEGTKEEGEAQAVVKGKRSKRYRSPHGPVPTSSSSVESLTEEEQDMANCLMLLASGAGRRREETEEENSSGGRGSPITRKVAAQLYECKTCGKCFQSFQALGGHRTSHKKTKAAAVNGPQEQKKAKIWRDEEGLLQMRIAPSYGDDLVVGKPKMHECSICGSEFTSGQALGGHMRRHRPVAPPAPAYPNQPNKERSHLSLDLNLPAPPEDVEGGDYEKSPSSSSGGAADFEFPEKPQPGHVVSLMNCHY